METKVGPLCSQDWKIQQKEVSRHYLTPEMVPGKIRHFLVASFYCSANIYDNTCLALYTRTIPYNMYVWRTPGTVHENDTYHILNTYEYYVVLAIGAAVALPWSLVGEIKVGKIKEPQSGTTTFGLTSLKLLEFAIFSKIPATLTVGLIFIKRISTFRYTQILKCSCRFVILATKALYSQAPRQVCIYTSYKFILRSTSRKPASPVGW